MTTSWFWLIILELEKLLIDFDFIIYFFFYDAESYLLESTTRCPSFKVSNYKISSRSCLGCISGTSVVNFLKFGWILHEKLFKS